MTNALARTLTAVLAAGLLLAVAPGAGAAAGAPAPACDRPGFLFCENFDRLPTGGPASLDWGVDTRAGTLTVERPATPTGRGQNLHVHTAGNGRAFLVAAIDPPGNSFYGRVRVRVAAFPTAPDWAHYTLVEASGPTAGAGVVRPLGGQYVPTLGTALWGVGSDGGPTGDWTSWQESAPSVAGRWQCVEWHQDASDNAVDVWIDGRRQADLSVDTTHHGGNPVDFVLPDVDTVRIGWQLYQSGPTPDRFDLWFDDVALATGRIGC
jgi:hypothetical protein